MFGVAGAATATVAPTEDAPLNAASPTTNNVVNSPGLNAAKNRLRFMDVATSISSKLPNPGPACIFARSG